MYLRTTKALQRPFWGTPRFRTRRGGPDRSSPVAPRLAPPVPTRRGRPGRRSRVNPRARSFKIGRVLSPRKGLLHPYPTTFGSRKIEDVGDGERVGRPGPNSDPKNHGRRPFEYQVNSRRRRREARDFDLSGRTRTLSGARGGGRARAPVPRPRPPSGRNGVPLLGAAGPKIDTLLICGVPSKSNTFRLSLKRRIRRARRVPRAGVVRTVPKF